jgi:hypothetical protein
MRFYASLFLFFWMGLGSLLAQTERNYPVHFNWGTEYFPENFSDASSQEVPESELVNGYFVRYVQVAEIPTARQREQLEDLGAKFLSYVHFGAYEMAFPVGFDLSALAQIQARSILKAKPEWKLARSLREPPYGEWAVHGDKIDVNIQVYPMLSIAEGAEHCKRHGITVIQEGRMNGFLQVRMYEENLSLYADLPFIKYMELVPMPGEPEDVNGRSIHRSNLLDVAASGGLHLNGEGVKTLVRDDGPLGPHIDFQGRLINIPQDPSGGGTHGDGVGGIIGGAGNMNQDNKGMADGATVYVVDYVANFQDTTVGLFLYDGLTITNSSYSNGCNAGYTLITQTVDKQIWENPGLMHVFSAGNSNNSDCGYGAGTQWGNITGGHKMGKNCIATANLDATSELVASSSRGPAHDGRLKPDIAAHGAGQISTDPDHQYQVFGGTSAAAPGIAGCLAQLTQGYKEQYGEQPNSALLKAALLNTANDLGNVGPDYKFGWGHVNAFRAWNLLSEGNYLDASVDQGGNNAHSMDIPFGTKYAKVMLYWHEQEANEGATRALINDLDLTITGPDGTVYQPWLLDPTPNPTILNTPAGNGRDSLNNMEQVALVDPAGGAYTVQINGFEVPMGPQPYYLVWEFYSDDVKLTYPVGGEGLVPGETARVHWDAYGEDTNFTLRYSTDDGNNWNPITTVSGDRRSFDWQVPNIATGSLRVLLIRGAKRDTSDFASTIAAVPSGLQVEKVCPDSMTITYNYSSDTMSFRGYLLGDKYMELVGTSDTTIMSFPISNPQAEQWVAVGAGDGDGLIGKRTLAIRWEGGLKNCPQPNDVAVTSLLQPSVNAIITCGAASSEVSIKVTNEGQNDMTGATASFQLNNEPVVTEALPDLAPGESVDFVFATTLTFTMNGNADLSVWASLPGDDVPFNDTLSYTIPVIVQAATAYFTEPFDGADFPPVGWTILNPDNGITWVKSPGQVVGIDGNLGYSLFLDCYSYSDQGQEDYIYVLPVDLSQIANPSLVFDLSHARYNATYTETLQVEAFTGCDLNQPPTVLWTKSDPDLATAPATTNVFFPDSPEDWRHEVVDLSTLPAEPVILRITSINGYGNSVYLDNIGVAEFNDEPPVAAFTMSADTICRGDTVTFVSTTTGDFVNYSWTFGALSFPSSATGIGPHDIRFLAPGTRIIRLIVSNSFGTDTLEQTLYIRDYSSADFTSVVNGLEVDFTSTSSGAVSYLWDFGDGNTSTEPNPTHTYASPGMYEVSLAIVGLCGDDEETQVVTTTSAITGIDLVPVVQVIPNPTPDNFLVALTAAHPVDVVLELNDVSGRQIKRVEQTLAQGLNEVRFEGLDLPSGLYPLNLITPSGTMTIHVAIQR